MTLLSIHRIRELFTALNDELASTNNIGEVGICGGAVMCLVYQAREATKDVDGIFEPSAVIRRASARVAKQFGVPADWLNDAAKSYFHVDPPREEVMQLSHLRVWAPCANYLLAMKCIAARFDSADADDVRFLIRYLELTAPQQVFDLIEQYYPRRQVPAKAQFFVEELFE